MLKIKVDKDYYDVNEKMYEKGVVTFNTGLTILVGCNGSGKTTLLHQIKDYCKNNKIPTISFNNYTDGGREMMAKHMMYGDMEGVARNFASSEGERISNALALQSNKIGNYIRKNQDVDKIVILMDAVDSGYSADNIVDLKRDLFDLIIEDCRSKGIEVYIIVAGNSYEMAANENCIDIVRLMPFVPKTYQRWRKVVMDTRKKKNKRYGLTESKLEEK